MSRFAIVMLGLISLVSAKPALLSVPLTYTTSLTSGTQVGTSRGQTLDRPKDSTAHLDERKMNSANEVWRTIGLREQESSRLDTTVGAPLGVDGRVVDTPEVAAAKAAHAAAHINEKINLANEAARSGSVSDSSGTGNDAILDDTITETMVGPYGRVRNTPEVTHVNGRINLETDDAFARLVDGSEVPLVLGNNVVAALVPVGLDGRFLNVPVVARGDQNPANDVRSVNALAIAGPALAYGRLIY